MTHLSVVIPVYNAARFLDAALESVLTQDFTDFELIAIDDGSSDGSLDILKHHSERDSRIRVISRENRGTIATRNEGISLANSDLIAWMDADDISMPERFSAQLAYLEEKPEVVAVGGQMLLIDSSGRQLCPMHLPCTHDAIDAHHMGNTGAVLFQGTVMCRKEAVLAVGGYDTCREAAEDFDLWLRLAEIGRLANLERPVLSYRQYLESTGYSKRLRQRRSAWEAIRSAAARRGVAFDLPSPEDEPLVTVPDVHRKWGWWALNAGNVGTARFYAIRTVRGAPWDRESWRLLACALRGH